MVISRFEPVSGDQVGQVEQHIFVVIFSKAAIAVVAGDIGRVAAGDQCLQLAVELLVRRFFHFDLDVRVLLLEIRNQLLDERAVFRINGVMRNRHLSAGAAVSCRHISRRFAAAAAGYRRHSRD
ncbi:hypothetical protein D3C73_1116390 [compost metagenome]